MQWNYPLEPGKAFDCKQDNDQMNKWLRTNKPWELNQFQADHYGIWEPVYNAKIIVTLIIKVPIMTNFTSIHNHKVIGLLDEMCDKVPGMAAAFVGATDMMVSDYNGNQPDAPVKYKCIYCKFSATKKIGVEKLFQTIPQ